MKNKILLYGGKSTSLIVYDMLKEKKKNISYIFDEFLKKTHFSHNANFSNKKKDLRSFIKNSNYFFVCIGMYDGKLRNYISDVLKKEGLKPLSIISKNAIIYDKKLIGEGFLAMPNSVVHRKTKIGKNCYLNVNSIVDHECQIGDGVHVMGSAYIAGRVKIENFASIGANSTILPDITIGKGAIVGAGAVVTKNVKSYEVVAGNPARFLRSNNKTYKLNIL
jgi:acetyltransferase EpsM